MDVREFRAVGNLHVVDAVNHENQVRMVLEFLAKSLEQVAKIERRHVVPDFETVVAHIAHQVASRI